MGRQVKLSFNAYNNKKWKCIEERVEVAGTYFRLNEALSFARGKGHDIALEHEPNNPHDRHAIKVIGITRGWLFKRKVHIGYIPRETVYNILQFKKYPTILPVLRDIRADDDSVYVKLDLLVPKNAK